MSAESEIPLIAVELLDWIGLGWVGWSSFFTRTWLHYVRVFAIENPSVVCNVRAPYTQGVEPFGNISPPLCTLAILLPPCQILRRSSQGNASIGGVKHKTCSKI